MDKCGHATWFVAVQQSGRAAEQQYGSAARLEAAGAESHRVDLLHREGEVDQPRRERAAEMHAERDREGGAWATARMRVREVVGVGGGRFAKRDRRSMRLL